VQAEVNESVPISGFWWCQRAVSAGSRHLDRWVGARAGPSHGRTPYQRLPQFEPVRSGWVWLAALEVPNYIASTWPASDIPQQIHLDLAVADLEVSATEAVRLGARPASYQPSPDQWRVFLDPAGHPFCLTNQVPIEIVRSSVKRADST
jgi:Glyoxalase-like domain